MSSRHGPRRRHAPPARRRHISIRWQVLAEILTHLAGVEAVIAKRHVSSGFVLALHTLFDLGLRTDLVPFDLGLQTDLVPFDLGLRTDLVPFDLGLRTDLVPFDLGLRIDLVPFDLGLRTDLVPFGLGLRTDLVPFDLGLRVAVGGAVELESGALGGADQPVVVVPRRPDHRRTVPGCEQVVGRPLPRRQVVKAVRLRI